MMMDEAFNLDDREQNSLGGFLDVIRQVGADSEIVSSLIRTDRSELERRWYGSLIAGVPDFTVYSTDDYLAEAWFCWRNYSRKYLRELQKKLTTLYDFSDVRKVIDLGCGIGYSTSALKGLFQRAEVVGTNVGNSPQSRVCAVLAQRYGFRIAESVEGLFPDGTDLIFASEYFEHFDNPLAHLLEILRYCSPRAMLIANTFTSPSIGHFPSYNPSPYPGPRLIGIRCSKAFNAVLRSKGYRKILTGFWNERPSLWAK